MNKNILYFLSITKILICTSAQFLQKNTLKLEIHSVNNCELESSWKWSQKSEIVNSSYLRITVDAVLDSALDDTVSITGTVKKHVGTSLKNIITLGKKKACSTVKHYGGNLFNEITKEVGLPNGNCPVPKGHYGLNDKTINLSQLEILRMLSGRYNIKVFGNDSRKVALFCVEAEASINSIKN